MLVLVFAVTGVVLALVGKDYLVFCTAVFIDHVSTALATTTFLAVLMGATSPAVSATQPYAGAQIEEDQHFLLRLTGPAVESTVLAHARCEIEGIGERVPVRIITGSVRDEVLKNAPVAEHGFFAVPKVIE